MRSLDLSTHSINLTGRVFFAPAAHTAGTVSPKIRMTSFSVTNSDLTVNTLDSVPTNPNSLEIGNWVDASGFNDGLNAAADLAVASDESFDFELGKGYRSIGFGVLTGTGNVTRDVDLNGAEFSFAAFDQSGTLIGTESLILSAGQIGQAWLTFVSVTPFHRFEVREVVNGPTLDQYFSSVLLSEQSAVPEPSSIVLIVVCVFSLIILRKDNIAWPQ